MSKVDDLKGLHVAMLVRWFADDGGLERYCHKLVEKLIASGLKITVVCEGSDSSLSLENLDIVTYGKSNEKLSKAETYRYAFRKTREIIDSLEGVDLIHSQHLPSFQFDVVTFHNHTVARLSLKGKGFEKQVNSLKVAFTDRYQTKDGFDKLLSTNAAVRIFVSNEIKDDYYRTFELGEDQPFVIAYPGCEPGNHDNRKAKDVETGELEQVEIGSREATTDLLCFLFVGKGYRMKGLDVLLSACRILKKRDFRFKLHVVGMSAKPIDILRLRFLGLLDCVEYRGYVDDMPREFALCKAIVTPSRLDSFGMAPLEAMQYGLVPVVGRNSGIAETIESEKNGLVLQDHLDAKELANLMGKLLSDRELLKVLSNGARAKAAEFTWEKTADATLDAYRLALASGAGRSTKKA